MATRLSWLSFTYHLTWLPKPLPPQPIWTQFNWSPEDRLRAAQTAELPAIIPAPAMEACLRNARRLKLEFIPPSMQQPPPPQNRKNWRCRGLKPGDCKFTNRLPDYRCHPRLAVLQ